MLAKFIIGLICIVVLCVAALICSLTYKLIRKIMVGS